MTVDHVVLDTPSMKYVRFIGIEVVVDTNILYDWVIMGGWYIQFDIDVSPIPRQSIPCNTLILGLFRIGTTNHG